MVSADATSPFLAGLYLGAVQAGYLLTLSRALSSAHLTYALVLGAWLAGAALGLWLAIAPRTALALGLTVYVAVQLTLTQIDFVAASPWCFAPAVAASGLWSGRFFVTAIVGRTAPGDLFARETDGFLVGALLATLGYAFLGRHALWVFPLVTGALLLRPRRARRP